ncbi:hypothetical protein M514_15846 [Trichuris suis]|uniref:Uncharacterized protein n=1 Tax=Trichuris suis TaxID=68888 RepID=A0A085NRP8_9BILA|nr:hypothetical protein M514_15846 [Trichuris suis]
MITEADGGCMTKLLRKCMQVIESSAADIGSVVVLLLAALLLGTARETNRFHSTKEVEPIGLQ